MNYKASARFYRKYAHYLKGELKFTRETINGNYKFYHQQMDFLKEQNISFSNQKGLDS